jgi:hypothetical protein
MGTGRKVVSGNCVPTSRLVRTAATWSCTQTFRQARAQAEKQGTIDAPGLIWWRAQLRRRNAATEKVGRPIAVAQTFAFTLSLLVAVVFAASQYRHGLRWSLWWAEISPLRISHLLAAGLANWNLPLLIPVLAAVAILSGLVVYVVAEKP